MEQNLDWLTELGNFYALDRALSVLEAGSALLAAEIAGLERVNAALGYRTGDECIRLAARLLREVPGGDAYRLGGRRFVVLLPATADLPTLSQALEESFSDALAEQFICMEAALHTGWAVYDPALGGPRDALLRAEAGKPRRSFPERL